MFLGGSMVQSRARLPKSIVVIMDVGSNPTQGKNFATLYYKTHYILTTETTKTLLKNKLLPSYGEHLKKREFS